jgi:hypothetical protein
LHTTRLRGLVEWANLRGHRARSANKADFVPWWRRWVPNHCSELVRLPRGISIGWAENRVATWLDQGMSAWTGNLPPPGSRGNAAPAGRHAST